MDLFAGKDMLSIEEEVHRGSPGWECQHSFSSQLLLLISRHTIQVVFTTFMFGVWYRK